MDLLTTEQPAGRAPGSPVLPVTILGTGISVPQTVVTNADLVATGLDTTDEWIRTRTGIRERRFLEPGRSTSDLCIEAAAQALRAAGIEPASLDAIVLATMTPDQPVPSTALIVKEALGAHRAIPIDLTQAACAGGVLGILLGAHLLQKPDSGPVLVIGGEAMSRLTDPADRTTRIFFGDAAGAVVLGRGDDGYGLLSWDMDSALSYAVEVRAGGASHPSSAETVAAGDHYLRMDGQIVWTEATERLPKSIEQAVASAGASVHDVAHFVLHQANRNIINEVMRRLGVDVERAGISLDRLGNTSAATVFTVLHTVVTNKMIQRDDLVVISGIGAGFIWGSLCLRYR
uniref:3-oxoacyl-(Acyl carrier protein) synthase III n=1 Tax=uncultured bacterium BAC AB649/1850 TaxID=1037453 RepID=F6K0Y0_9BACT|nr:3-oxoacyl-(acyl carrier protein) synthase III [uncultured bacterium BAC AB649/1850]